MKELNEMTVYQELTALFESPKIRDLPGGKPPRTTITTDLEQVFDLIVRICDPDLFIEIGAFDASFSRRSMKAFPKARAVAFEANPLAFEKYFALNAAEGVDYRHLAISSSAGTIEIHVPKVIAGRQLPEVNTMASVLDIGLRDSESVRVAVPTNSLDGAIDRSFSKAVLWIDVEGAADMVISGGRHCLARTPAVMMEVEDRPVWKGQALAGDLIKKMQEHGFEAACRDCQKAFQHNIIFLKPQIAASPRVREAIANFIMEAKRALSGPYAT